MRCTRTLALPCWRTIALVLVLAAWLGQADPAQAERSASPSIDVVFALDNSGSMRANDPGFLARQAVLDFADALGRSAAAGGFDARIGLVLFDETIRFVLPLAPVAISGDPAGAFARALARLDYTGQRTRSADAIERALYTLRVEARPGARQAIVLLTDGRIDTGDAERDRTATEWLRDDLAGEARERGVRIFGLAFTDDADYHLLQAVARRTEADYYRAARADELTSIAGSILARVTQPTGDPDGSLQATRTPPRDRAAASSPPVAAAPPGPERAPSTSTSIFTSTPTSTALRLGWLPALLFLTATGGFLGLQARGRSQRARDRQERAARRVPPAQLLDVGGVLGETGRSFPLRSGRTRIGRDPHNDLVLADAAVSSEHATIERADGRYWLVDLRSTNGTRHGNRRLAEGERVALKGGDHVRFADVDLMFVYAGHVPSGATALLPSTSAPIQADGVAHERAGSSPGERRAIAARAQPGDAYRDCLDYHLARVAELSPDFARLVARAFDPEMREAIRRTASELVESARREDRIAQRSYTRDRIRYVLCGAAGGMDNAARAYRAAHGGFSRLLSELYDDESFRADRCEVLVVLTFGASAGVPWVTLSVVPDEDRHPHLDLLSYELLSEAEREALEPAPARAETSQSGRA